VRFSPSDDSCAVRDFRFNGPDSVANKFTTVDERVDCAVEFFRCRLLLYEPCSGTRLITPDFFRQPISRSSRLCKIRRAMYVHRIDGAELYFAGRETCRGARN
jgi:hypothetical protein